MEATSITCNSPRDARPIIALQLRVAKFGARFKDHKRKHDDEDDEDDDDEGPSAGSNQGKSTKRRRHDSGASGSAQPPPKDSDASASKQHPTLTSTGWQITDTRDAVIDSSMHRSEPESGHSEHSSDDVTAATWFKPIPEDERPATPEPEWTIPPNDFPEPRNNGQSIRHKKRIKRTGKKKLCKADLEGPAFNLVKAFHKNNEDHQVRVFPSLWVESERDYDISAAYGITHWWLRRKQFYINKHSEPSDREAVRSQMRILSVIRVKTFEKYGYNYLREIILRRADYKEYKISKKDFKNLHPNDFEDLYLLNIQDKLNHLSKSDKIHLHTAVNMWIRNLVIRNRVGDLQLGIESYQTKLNLERPNWDATDYSFKEDYTIVPKPRAVIYRDRNDQRKLMRLNEIHKFSDGTLTRVMEKLDHMVKDFHL
ncbi:hypothetical protein Tco_0797561 [Tanacetum coccineum]